MMLEHDHDVSMYQGHDRFGYKGWCKKGRLPWSRTLPCNGEDHYNFSTHLNELKRTPLVLTFSI